MSSLVAIVAGGVFGGLWQGGFGALVGALLVWLLQRTLRQDKLIGELGEALKDLQALRRAFAEQTRAAQARDAEAQRTAVAEPAAGPSSASDALPVQPAGAPVDSSSVAPLAPPMQRPVDAARAPPAAAAVAAAAAASPAAATSPAASPAAAMAQSAWAAAAPPRARPPVDAAPRPDPLAPIKAWLFGGNTIVKAGIGILFVGLAFLAKYASEHVHVPVELRLSGIAAVALVLLVLGWRLRHRRRDYAQVLQGGAVAVLYLTLFVAFRFYGVLAVGPVFALMVAVAALSAALAVLQDARALAVIGALGGFAAPLLISTGAGNHLALFSYYLVLDAGIALVAWYRIWRALNLIGFACTFIVASAWGALKYHSAHYASSQAFLAAFFLLFVAIMLMPVRGRGDGSAATGRSDAWVQGALLFGLPTITFVLQYGLVRDTEYGVALSALVLAAFYVALAAWMRRRPGTTLAFEGSLAVGTVFLTLVIPFALDARGTAGAWALEGAGLVWLGLRQSRALARAFGYALLLLAGLAMIHAYDRNGAPTAWLNATCFNALLVAAASLAAAWFVQRRAVPHAAADGGWVAAFAARESIAEPLLIAWGVGWLVAAAAVQIDAFVDRPLQLAAWLASFSAIALLCTALAVRLGWHRVGLPAMAHAPLHALGAVVLLSMLARPTDEGGWWAWPLALVVHGLVLWRLAPAWPAPVRTAVHTLGALIVAALGALQGRALTADWGDALSAWPWLGWLIVPAALLALLPRRALAPRWPIRTAPEAYRTWAAGVLTASLLLWTVIANVASSGSARPLPHVPLANPLDLGVGVALLASWVWLRSDGARDALRHQPALPAALIGAAGFVWLNAMLVRGFHHYAGVPFRFDAWVRSLAVQTGLTLLWSATALAAMWLGARRGLRGPWLAGAALLAAVVVKLLLVDLSGTGTVTRIVSFIGVGVLMLVIGYVAPLPSAKDRHATA